MKLVALLTLLLSPLAYSGVFSTEHVQAYPSDWPKLTGISNTCAEVQGSYSDPNSWRWEREEIPGSPLGAKYGGTREAAWIVFGLPAKEIQSEKNVKTRAFTVMFNPDQSVTVNYLIDGTMVTSRSFAKETLSCGKDGLTITILDRTGVVLDKFPNEGHTVRRSTIYKLNEHLYVKITDETNAKVIKVVPQSFLNVRWFRFPEQTSR